MSDVIKDGYRRLIHPDCVDWYTHPGNRDSAKYRYCVSRFPFVPDYHLCEFVTDKWGLVSEYPIQQFKTLTQALAVLRVLDANLRTS